MTRAACLVALFALGTAAAAPAAPAAPVTILPPPIFFDFDAWENPNGPVSMAPGIVHILNCDDMNNCESSDFDTFFANGGSSASMSGSSTFTLLPNGLPPLNPPTSKARTLVKFDFAVIGTSLAPAVPVVVRYNASATADGAGRAEALGFIQVIQSGVGAEAQFCDSTQVGACAGYGIPSSSISGTVSINVVPNRTDPSTAASVALSIQGEAYQGSYFAKIDPTVSFAPGFNSTGLSLIFSPNPVPEPATSTLMALGLASVVGWYRSRRSN